MIYTVPTTQFDILIQKAPPRREWSDDTRQFPVVLGVVSTILFHLLLWFLLPLLPMSEPTQWTPPEGSTKGKTLHFILERLPEALPEPEQFRFVETNPEAPTNEPDKTANISNRNQQTAQEVAATEIDPHKRPSVQGDKEIDHNPAIVAGQGAPAQEAAAAQLPLQSEDQPAQEARMALTPLRGFEKFEGDAPGGVGSNISKSELATNSPDRSQTGVADSQKPDGQLTTVRESAKPQPKPRPRLKPARPNLLSNQIAGTTNVGVLGLDARWSEFGEYMQEFIEIVQSQFDRVTSESPISPRGSHVYVTFNLNSDGEVTILKVEETAGQHGVYLSLNALQERQPYRKWTQAMIAMMGTETTMTFRFMYQ